MFPARFLRNDRCNSPVDLRQTTENSMKVKIVAATTAMIALMAVPAVAQDVPHRAAVTAHENYASTHAVRQRDSGFWPDDVAAGVIGGALGTVGAIASAPFHAFDNSYAYYDENAGYPYNKEYGYRISRNDLSGPICVPGTRVMGEDGRLYRCQ